MYLFTLNLPVYLQILLRMLIKNGSDLVEPVRIVREELILTVGIINPHKKPSRTIIRHVSFIKKIRKGVLSNNQFPETLKGPNGTFHKTDKW